MAQIIFLALALKLLPIISSLPYNDANCRDCGFLIDKTA